MPTPHISAEPGAFAADVIMPGDPRRARKIADQVLEDPVLVTDVRGICGFTGTHAGQPLSVMASGMGMPSLTIYATELVREYGVKRIVRVGTAGALTHEVRVRDVVVAMGAHTDSGMTRARVPGAHCSHLASYPLLRRALDSEPTSSAREANTPSIHVGAVFTTDHFYLDRPELMTALSGFGTKAVEMEAAALYAVAAAEGCEALAITTITDHLLTNESLSAQERQDSFQQALRLGLAALAS